MKSVRNSLSVLMLVLLVSAVGTDTLAQGRGRGHNKENHPGKGHKKDRDHDHDYSSRNNRYYSHNHYVTYHHHRYGRPAWAPLYGHRYNTRYIYYRDYNVYYDCYSDAFVTWAGGRWVITTRVPRVLVSVNFNNVVVTGVDYWDDDFNFYLERRRPAYVSIRASF